MSNGGDRDYGGLREGAVAVEPTAYATGETVRERSEDIGAGRSRVRSGEQDRAKRSLGPRRRERLRETWT